MKPIIFILLFLSHYAQARILTADEVASNVCKAFKAQNMTLLAPYIASQDRSHFEIMKRSVQEHIISKQEHFILNIIDCTTPTSYSGGVYKKYSFGSMNFRLKYDDSRWKYLF